MDVFFFIPNSVKSNITFRLTANFSVTTACSRFQTTASIVITYPTHSRFCFSRWNQPTLAHTLITNRIELNRMPLLSSYNCTTKIVKVSLYSAVKQQETKKHLAVGAGTKPSTKVICHYLELVIVLLLWNLCHELTPQCYAKNSRSPFGLSSLCGKDLTPLGTHFNYNQMQNQCKLHRAAEH